MRVRITRLSPAVPLPAYQTPGAVGFDLAASTEVAIPAKSAALVPTGLIIATPPGYALILTARSSLFRKKGLLLANGVGTIDQDYCGPEDELKLSLWNPGTKDIIITPGERLAQGLFLPIEKAEWEEAAPEAANRGGFGTTG